MILFLAVILTGLTNQALVSLVIFLFGIPASIIGFAALLFVSYEIRLFAYKTHVLIDKFMVYTMINIQIFLIVFNFGDCSSNTNHVDTNFIQRVIVTGFECEDLTIKPWIPQEIIFGLYMLNLFILAIFIIRTLASAHAKTA